MSTTEEPSAKLSLKEFVKSPKAFIDRLSDRWLLGLAFLVALILGPILAGLLNWILFFR